MPSGLPRASFSYVTRLTHSTQPTHSTTRLTRPVVHSEKTTTRPSNSLDCIDSLTPRTQPHADANPRAVSQWFVQKVRDRPISARVLLRPCPLELCIRPSTPLPIHSTQGPTNPGPAECAKRLNNEQLNCNCTATGFALSRVCILIGKRATAREEGKEKREERREMVRSQKSEMVELRVGL